MFLSSDIMLWISSERFLLSKFLLNLKKWKQSWLRNGFIMGFLYEFKDSENMVMFLKLKIHQDRVQQGSDWWLQNCIFCSLSSFDFQSRPISALLQGKNDQIYFFQAEVMHRSKLIFLTRFHPPYTHTIDCQCSNCVTRYFIKWLFLEIKCTPALWVFQKFLVHETANEKAWVMVSEPACLWVADTF